ncbi:MAG: hypothetical protein ACEQSK_16215 [Sphingomonadaceae bacterium]
MKRLLAGLLCLVAAAQSLAACDVPATPQPAWIDAPGSGIQGAYFGNGTAQLERGADLSQVRARALNDAQRNAAQMIQSSVRSESRSIDSKLTEAGRTVVKERFEAIAEVTSKLSLQGLRLSDQWIDAASCQLWVRVQVSAADAALARDTAVAQALASQVRTLLEQAGRRSDEATRRRQAVIEAEQILPQVDATLVPGFVADAIRYQLGELNKEVQVATNALTQFQDALARHTSAFGALTTAASNTERRARAADALRWLRAALAAGAPATGLPFGVDDRMAQLHGETGALCLGGLWFTAQGKAVPASLRTGPACDSSQIARERRALYFSGKPVQLSCHLTLDGKRSDWGKACALLRSQLAGEGAVLGAQHGPDAVRIELSAAGKVLQRQVDGQAELAFDGKITSSVQGPERLSLSDDTQGRTGWQPVSVDMTTDLLALGAFRKLNEALTAYWEQP